MCKRIVFLLVAFVCVIGLGFAATIGARSDEPENPTVVQVRLRDFCDPVTFNLAVGPGTCVRGDSVSVNGATKFAGFLAELGQEKSAGAWRFNPDTIRAEEGTKLVLVNRGGETHTFTRVAEFGGGFIAVLNTLSGNPVPRPECARVLPNGNLVPQPETPDNLFVEAGTTEQGPTIRDDDKEIKFECCIHPWMRTIVNPKRREHD